MSYVWLGKDGETIFLQHCPKCSLENWAPSVALGICAWCGYKADKKDVENDILKQQLAEAVEVIEQLGRCMIMGSREDVQQKLLEAHIFLQKLPLQKEGK